MKALVHAVFTYEYTCTSPYFMHVLCPRTAAELSPVNRSPGGETPLLGRRPSRTSGLSVGLHFFGRRPKKALGVRLGRRPRLQRPSLLPQATALSGSAGTCFLAAGIRSAGPDFKASETRSWGLFWRSKFFLNLGRLGAKHATKGAKFKAKKRLAYRYRQKLFWPLFGDLSSCFWVQEYCSRAAVSAASSAPSLAELGLQAPCFGRRPKQFCGAE